MILNDAGEMNGQNPKTELTPEEIEIVEGKGVK